MNYGLKKTKYDPRDFHLRKTFGSTSVALPDEYVVGSCPVKNQMSSEFCTAFASCVLAEIEDSSDYSAEWFFAKEVAQTGDTSGQDLRTPCQTAVNYGFLSQNLALNTTLNQSPAFLADPKNWPASDDLEAALHKRQSYYRCDGTFDEIKQTIFQNKKAVITGINWYNEFTSAPSGVCPTTYNQLGGLHCIPIIGFKKINGVDYLIVQNSYGTQVGDNGLFYFNEQIFEQLFTEPMYIFIAQNDVIPKPIGNYLQVLLKNLLVYCNFLQFKK